MTQRLGPYELLREVGYGGMGSVFLGKRQGLGGFHKWVAIKTIHPHLAKEAAFVTAFLDEARIAASMQHPNVTTVFDVGEADGTYYLAMEYLHGEHLGAFQETGPVDPYLAAYAVARAAEGLHHAHEATDERGVPRGLVHRDVSPHNIFLTYDGHVKVTDFGIARAEGRLAQTTDTGRIKGKCAYMAPEQVQAHPLDRRADLFALGVVLWELTTDARLYVGSTDAQTLLAILRDEPRKPSWLVANYPPVLEAIVMKALSRERENRYASCAELAEALDAFVASAPRPVGSRELAALMAERFADQRAEKDAALRSGSARAGAARVATPSSTAETVAAEAPLATPVEPPVRPHPKKRRRWAPLAGIALLGALGVAGGVIVGSGPTPASVRVASEPSGARVRVDGRAIEGTTPVVVDDVEPGRHSLRLELDGFAPHEVSFDVDGRPLELSYPLRAEPVLAVGQDAPSSEGPSEPPSEANEVPSSDEAPSNDANEASSNEASSNDAPSMNAVASDTPRRPRRTAPTTTAAEPAGRATLSLLTEPWATVRIDGRDFGRTPLFAREIPSGRLQIELRARGEGSVVTRSVQAAPGESVSLRVTLPD